jgi:hypothetical protein
MKLGEVRRISVFQTVQMKNVLFNFFKNTCICTLMMSLFMLLTAIAKFLIRFFIFFSMGPREVIVESTSILFWCENLVS